MYIQGINVSERTLAQADETLITLNANGTLSYRRLNSRLRKAGATKLLKLGCIGSLTPFLLANGTPLLHVIVIKTPEGKEVTMNIPLDDKKVLIDSLSQFDTCLRDILDSLFTFLSNNLFLQRDRLRE